MTRLPSHFYAMVDPAGGHDPVSLAETLLDAGARIMQLRLKDAPGRDFLAAARTIAEMCRRRGAILIVNDRVDIAILAGADGVHLGQTDLPLEAARLLVGRERTGRRSVLQGVERCSQSVVGGDEGRDVTTLCCFLGEETCEVVCHRGKPFVE